MHRTFSLAAIKSVLEKVPDLMAALGEWFFSMLKNSRDFSNVYEQMPWTKQKKTDLCLGSNHHSSNLPFCSCRIWRVHLYV